MIGVCRVNGIRRLDRGEHEREQLFWQTEKRKRPHLRAGSLVEQRARRPVRTLLLLRKNSELAIRQVASSGVFCMRLKARRAAQTSKTCLPSSDDSTSTTKKQRHALRYRRRGRKRRRDAFAPADLVLVALVSSSPLSASILTSSGPFLTLVHADSESLLLASSHRLFSSCRRLVTLVSPSWPGL